MPYIPHTLDDTCEMLKACKIDSIQDLFDEIPASLIKRDLVGLPQGLTEQEITRLYQSRSNAQIKNKCFIGAGAYEHFIPALVGDIISKGEWYTSYTPYQAEASQGTLQLLWEFQSMICELTGMDVANASMYDGATSLAEAILMAKRLSRKKDNENFVAWIPKDTHPNYLATCKTILKHQKIELVEINFCEQLGVVTEDLLNNALNNFNKPDVVIISQPNFFGQCGDVDKIADFAHTNGAKLIACVNPISLAWLKEPRSWGKTGADIVIGSGQSLGIPLSFGGPYFGFFACQKQYVRQLPGRLVGKTIDKNNKECFTLTLQAREQHIRRSKATSNICTNQGLMVTAASVYMSLMGPDGLSQVAKQSFVNTQHLSNELIKISNIKIKFDSASFCEQVIELPIKASEFINGMRKFGIEAGLKLTNFDNCILVCVTETKSAEDIAEYVKCAKKVIENQVG